MVRHRHGPRPDLLRVRPGRELLPRLDVVAVVLLREAHEGRDDVPRARCPSPSPGSSASAAEDVQGHVHPGGQRRKHHLGRLRRRARPVAGHELDGARRGGPAAARCRSRAARAAAARPPAPCDGRGRARPARRAGSSLSASTSRSRSSPPPAGRSASARRAYRRRSPRPFRTASTTTCCAPSDRKVERVSMPASSTAGLASARLPSFTMPARASSAASALSKFSRSR